MTEEAELQAKIAAIAGQINQHKQEQLHGSPNGHHRNGPPIHRGRGYWSPYGRGGRGGRPGRPHVPMNRTLVLNGSPATPSPASEPATPNNEPAATPTPAPDAFIATRRPGMNQLINRDAYDREQKQKQEHHERTRASKRQKVDRDERSKLSQYTSTHSNREITVEGIRFQLREDGSKLIRISDDKTTKETPRSVKIADVTFFRTKNGNLVRANALKDAKRPQQRKKTAQCEHFTKHGTCPRGPMCKFAHDPNKVVACPKYLKFACTQGDDCDLSHTPTYSNTPACTHFLRGRCTNDACRYPHVHVSPTAPVCADFARLGYCDNQGCDKRHVVECPDYANTGYCAKYESGRCALPHPDRASTLRKAAARQAKKGSDNDSDVSSDEENQENVPTMEDIDSDDLEDMTMTDVQNYGHELTQQQDFIGFT